MQTLLRYLWYHKLMSGVAVYFIIAIFLKLQFSIDILIPCIWKALTGYSCPGCGMTRSFMELLFFDFEAAFEQNPLIFIVLPAGIFYTLMDFRNFRKREQEKNLTKTD